MTQAALSQHRPCPERPFRDDGRRPAKRASPYRPSCGEAARLASLQDADAKITTGLFYDADGTEHRIESGRDDKSERVLATLYDMGVAQPPVRPNVVDHVEAKVAALMRENDLSSGVLVINFPRGVCGTESPQPYSCAAIVPAILPEEAMLAVWSPRELNEGRPSVKLTGDAR